MKKNLYHNQEPAKQQEKALNIWIQMYMKLLKFTTQFCPLKVTQSSPHNILAPKVAATKVSA